MCESTVISYIISRWIIWLIVVILLGVIFTIFSFVSHIKKYRWWILIPFVLITLYTSIPTIAGVIDITQETYITEQVNYYRSDASNTRNSLIASESIQVTTTSGNTIILKGATRHFPYGKYTGTVTYAKQSRIAISFTPDKTD